MDALANSFLQAENLIAEFDVARSAGDAACRGQRDRIAEAARSGGVDLAFCRAELSAIQAERRWMEAAPALIQKAEAALAPAREYVTRQAEQPGPEPEPESRRTLASLFGLARRRAPEKASAPAPAPAPAEDVQAVFVRYRRLLLETASRATAAAARSEARRHEISECAFILEERAVAVYTASVKDEAGVHPADPAERRETHALESLASAFSAHGDTMALLARQASGAARAITDRINGVEPEQAGPSPDVRQEEEWRSDAASRDLPEDAPKPLYGGRLPSISESGKDGAIRYLDARPRAEEAA